MTNNFVPSMGFLTKTIRNTFLTEKVKDGTMDFESAVNSMTLYANEDKSEPLYFWQLTIHSVKEYNPQITHLEKAVLGLKNLNMCSLPDGTPCDMCYSPYWWTPSEAKHTLKFSSNTYANDAEQWTNTWTLQYWSIPEKMITGFFKGPKRLSSDKSFEDFYKKCKALAEKRDLFDGGKYNFRIDALMIYNNNQCWYYRLKKDNSLKLHYSNCPMKSEMSHIYGQVKKYIGDESIPIPISCPHELTNTVKTNSLSTRSRGVKKNKNCGFC